MNFSMNFVVWIGEFNLLMLLSFFDFREIPSKHALIYVIDNVL